MFEVTTIKDVKLKIGEVCKDLRRKNGLTRIELAKDLAVSSTTIQNIENGKNSTLDNLLKVAYHFGYLETLYKQIEKNLSDQDEISLY